MLQDVRKRQDPAIAGRSSARPDRGAAKAVACEEPTAPSAPPSSVPMDPISNLGTGAAARGAVSALTAWRNKRCVTAIDFVFSHTSGIIFYRQDLSIPKIFDSS